MNPESISKGRVTESLVKSCLFNWLGYGKINSSIWFIGTEESGGEIWRNKIRTQTLDSSLKIRSKFKLSMDFCHVWEDLYGIKLRNFKGPTVWCYIACFLLNFQNEYKNRESIKKFVFEDKKLGRKNSDHFLCEFFPLPKGKKNSIKEYVHIWPTIEDYYSEVKNRRFWIINEKIKNNKEIKLIVSYEKELTKLILDYYKNDVSNKENWLYHGKKSCEKYDLYKINFYQNRNIFLLSTPFFGYGRISYNGLKDAIKKIRKLVKKNREFN